ncbi:MAG: helix-turn-helix transcriptional regulator [Firmicutes bacterium]|nr:helix-turn-helix transcriptional regulator [Bacillota bacterium]
MCLERKIIKDKRTSLSLSHGEVAKAIGISRSFYTQIENGTRDPSFRVARKIASFYEISLDEIFLKSNVATDNMSLA